MAFALCVGITLCVIAWGYLVYAAIDFGTAARGGDGAPAWGLLALASLGAVACLFFGLMLVARLMRVLGITRGAESSGGSVPPASPAAPASASASSSASSPSASERPGPRGDAGAPGASLGAAQPPAPPAPAPPARTSHAAPHGTPHTGPRPRGGKRAAR